MKHIKKSRIVASLLVMIAVVLVCMPSGMVLADEGSGESPKVEIDNPLASDNLADLIAAIVRIARNIGFLVAVIAIIYAGFMFVTARGNASKLETAKKAFLWAVVGAAVILGAQLFADAIENTYEDVKKGAEQDYYRVVENVLLT